MIRVFKTWGQISHLSKKLPSLNPGIDRWSNRYIFDNDSFDEYPTNWLTSNRYM